MYSWSDVPPESTALVEDSELNRNADALSRFLLNKASRIMNGSSAVRFEQRLTDCLEGVTKRFITSAYPARDFQKPWHGTFAILIYGSRTDPPFHCMYARSADFFDVVNSLPPRDNHFLVGEEINSVYLSVEHSVE